MPEVFLFMYLCINLFMYLNLFNQYFFVCLFVPQRKYSMPKCKSEL